MDRQKKVLFLVNHDIVIYNFRRELVERLLEERYEVVISSPYGERIELLKAMGCRYVPVDIQRHGRNPIAELKLFSYYKRLLKEEKPQAVLGYTIKPNLYGALAAGRYGIPCVVNITGLGTAVEHPGMMRKIILAMYRFAFRKVQAVFVQNRENEQFFLSHKIAADRLKLLPGSGVNLEQFAPLEYPEDPQAGFAFISRIMKEKGIDQYLEMAEYIHGKYPDTRFHVCGFCEEAYEPVLRSYEEKGIIVYHGLVMDVREILKDIQCTVHPSYYPEGISNVLLESAACARPVITTDRSGCRECVEDGVSGYVVPQKDTESLIAAVERFLMLDREQRREMGLAGRRKMERKFDRQIVVEAYMEEIGNA